VQTAAIAKASPRATACLLAAEDLASDLGAERGQDGLELAYCRQRFIVECVAAGVVAVDCPYTWSDVEGVGRDTRWARRLGYVAKSLVDPAHATVVNAILSPDDQEISHARDIVAAFEQARAKGEARVELNGSQWSCRPTATPNACSRGARPCGNSGAVALAGSSARADLGRFSTSPPPQAAG
jgi:citrate lyase subunit beta / citryl-CoA lyase